MVRIRLPPAGSQTNQIPKRASNSRGRFQLPVSGAVAAYLTTQVQSHGDIRLVVAPDNATVAATYAGATNTTIAAEALPYNCSC